MQYIFSFKSIGLFSFSLENSRD